MSACCALDVSVSVFYDPKLVWEDGRGPRRLKERQERARVEADCTISAPRDEPACVLHEILTVDGKKAAESVEELEGDRDSRTIYLPEPAWWSLEAPVRYTLVSTLLCGENSCACTHPFGLRAVSYHPAWGFLVNGEPLALHGVSLERRPDRPQEKETLAAQLLRLKQRGVHLLRVFAPDDTLLDGCDEAGLLVDAGLFRAGESAALSREEAERLARERIERITRHPCAVLWHGAEKQENEWLAGLMEQAAPKANLVCAAEIPFTDEALTGTADENDAYMETGAFFLPDAAGDTLFADN